MHRSNVEHEHSFCVSNSNLTCYQKGVHYAGIMYLMLCHESCTNAVP